VRDSGLEPDYCLEQFPPLENVAKVQNSFSNTKSNRHKNFFYVIKHVFSKWSTGTVVSRGLRKRDRLTENSIDRKDAKETQKTQREINLYHPLLKFFAPFSVKKHKRLLLFFF